MNPLARLKQMRKAHRLYNSLVQGDTRLLVELFPFVKLAFTPKVIELPLREPKKPLPPPKVSYSARSEEDDLRDALDIGFGDLKFDSNERRERERNQ